MIKAVTEVPRGADIQYRHLIRNDSGHCFMTTVNWDNSDSVSSCVRVADSISCGGFIGQGTWREMLILAFRTVWWYPLYWSVRRYIREENPYCINYTVLFRKVELYVRCHEFSLNKVLWSSKILHFSLFFFPLRPTSGYGLLILEVSWSHTTTHYIW